MKKKQTITILLITFLFSTLVNAQNAKPAVDYLNVPGPVIFDKQFCVLSWSSHPSANFYKQEYLLKGEPANQYKTMILLDVVTGETNIKNVVSAKASELKKMKESNPVINYEVIQNPATAEYMIDFLLTANATDGSVSIAERNVYRYKVFTDKNGKKGIMLFGISKRGYGKDVQAFIASLKSARKDLITKVSQFKMPDITVKN